ncbi:hypothetical protein CROQUDRAFT_106341 [Cronartium quercuum f. sp. fusiforme G11]|uniref:Uncharacterized protein n=1 Tax=Cronartium quercuum f. sp. fusiforme G11 TaxID=708437 RepID=A0A9P6TCT2_9BASI|nr:hypothetical protein CROQUDRAFT_106341 [Cronartium quercuum f. sp. fusiforme G11]
MTVIIISSGLIVGGIILGTISFSALVSTAPLEKILKGVENDHMSSMPVMQSSQHYRRALHEPPPSNLLSYYERAPLIVRTREPAQKADTDNELYWKSSGQDDSDGQGITSVETLLSFINEQANDILKNSHVGEDLNPMNPDSNPVDGSQSIPEHPISHTPDIIPFSQVTRDLVLNAEIRQKNRDIIAGIEHPRQKGEGSPCDEISGLPLACGREGGVLGAIGHRQAKKDTTYGPLRLDLFSLDKNAELSSSLGQGSINENMSPSYMNSDDVKISLNHLIRALLKHYITKMILLQKISKATGPHFLKLRSWIKSIWNVVTSLIEKRKNWTYRKTPHAKIWSDDAMHLGKPPNALHQKGSSMNVEII